MPSAVWGLDIGHSSIKAVRLERAGSVAELTTFDVIEIEHDDDESTRPVRVHAALTELKTRRRIGAEPVIISVPGNQTFFRPFSLPIAAAQSKLAGIVSFEARNQIPFPIDEVLWDYKQIAPGDGGEIRVGLMAVRRELIDHLINTVQVLNMRLEAIQVAPLALYNLVSYEMGGAGPWVVLDGGSRVTEFVVVDGEEFWFRPLPQSGSDLTRALGQKFRMTFEEAEALKLKMGESKQAQKIFQVLEPMLRNLVGDIQRTIGYYKSARGDVEFKRFLAVGNAFRLPGMIEFLEQILDVKITTLDQLGRVRLGPGVDVGWWKEELPAMSVAVGLALQGVGLAPAALDLLPEAIRHERMLQRKRWWVAGGVAAAILASVASYFAAVQERKSLGTNLDDIKIGLSDAKRFDKSYDLEKEPIEKDKSRLRQWSENTARDRAWVALCLDELARVGGHDRRPVLGPKAADGNGVHLKEVIVSRRNPAEFIRNLDEYISTAYADITREGAHPLVVGVQAEVYGPKFRDDSDMVEADIVHAQDLCKAIEFSSRVEMRDGAVLRGRVTKLETKDAQDKVTKVEIQVEKKPGGETVTQDLKDVKHLAWVRKVILGPGWKRDVCQVSERKGDVEPWKRHYLLVSLAWVVDDGSTELPAEEAARP